MATRMGREQKRGFKLKGLQQKLGNRHAIARDAGLFAHVKDNLALANTRRDEGRCLLLC
jgi:hypothetical protein